MKNFKFDLLLLLVVITWGVTFPLSKITLEGFADAAPFMAARFVLGALTLWMIAGMRAKKQGKEYGKALFQKRAIFGGAVIGVCGAVGMLLQTYGMYTTSASNSAFITGAYVLLIPLFSRVFYKTKLEVVPLIGLFVSAFGLLLVCNVFTFSRSGITVGLTALNIGDLLTFGCAFLFALQVSLMDHYTKTCENMAIALWQVTVTAAVCVAAWLILDRDGRLSIWNSFMIPNLLLCGIVASGLASLILAVGVARTTPTHAAVILSLEPVTGTAAALIIPNLQGIRETLTPLQLIGSLIILASIIAVETVGARKAAKAIA
jgi:drug/metabolite transporter (DMT)-like permease